MIATADRNLVFAALALDRNLVTPEQFVTAVQRWIAAPRQPLAQILQEFSALSQHDRANLDLLVSEHIGRLSDHSQASVSTVEFLPAESASATTDGDPYRTQTTAPPAIEADPQPPGRADELPRFEILRFHAQGGLGRVFVARDRELGREVALKEIRPERAHDPVSQSRFVREAEITGGLEHPGIVPVYALGAYPDGRPYYAMRFIPGSSLQDEISSYQQSPVRSAPRNLRLRRLLQRLIDVCKAVEYAHRRGILHRDLKPANIMVGDFGESLVVDWGLAKPLRSAATGDRSVPTERHPTPLVSPAWEKSQANLIVGSPAYMSPEQARGDNDALGPSADVFSLGAILYTILTGRPPYSGSTRDEVLERARRADYPSPRSLGPDIAPALAAICLKALAAQPAGRYESAQQLAEDLERHLADEAVLARRETLSERLGRLARRHRAWVRAIAVALVAVSIAATTAAFLVNLSRRGERVAKEVALQRLSHVENGVNVLALVFDNLNPRRALAAYGGQAGRPDQEQQLRVVLGQNLARAAELLNADTIGDELMVARLQTVLGASLVDLGDWQRALPALESATQTRERWLGRDNPLTLVSLNNQAAAHKQAGHRKDAIRLLTEVLDRSRRIFPPTHPELVQSANNLAAALLDDGQTVRGIELLEEAQALAQQLPASAADKKLMVQNNLATAYLEQQRVPEAIALLESVHQQRGRTFGPSHLDTLETAACLGAAYSLVGRAPDAVALLEPAASELRSSVGESHPSTLDCETNLAECYRALNRVSDTVNLLDDVLRRSRLSPSRGAKHPQTLLVMNNLGSAYTSIHNPQAISLLEECLKLREEVLGNESPDTISTVINLAWAFVKENRSRDAVPLYERATAAWGEEHPQSASLQAILGLSYLDAGRAADAVVMLEKVHRSRVQQAPDSEAAAMARMNLAKACLADGQPERALQLIREFVLLHRRAADDLHHGFELFKIGGLLIQHQQFSSAEEFARASHVLLQRTRPGAWPALSTQLLLGEALAKQRKFTDAEPLLVSAYDEIHKLQTQQPTADGPDQLTGACERLLMLYETWEKAEEAQRWRERLDQLKTRPKPALP